jgi:hypothetical protein
MFINIIGGGLTAIFLRIDNNLKILIEINGGQPIEDGIDVENTDTKHTEIETKNVVLTGNYHVVSETALHDSLSVRSKTLRLLIKDEEVNVKHINNRPEIGGDWALIDTKTGEEGWCLLSSLIKNA